MSDLRFPTIKYRDLAPAKIEIRSFRSADETVVFASLLVTFREALEASLIVTIVSAYLRRIGRTELNRYLAAGALLAVVTSIGIGGLIQYAYGGLSETPLQAAFEGVAAILATIVLTLMIFWMGKHAKNIRREIEQRVEVAVSKGQVYSIFSLAFISVLREGIETVLFLTGVFFLDPSGTILGITLGVSAVLGIILLFLRGTYKLDLRPFFKYTSVLLVVLSAGLAGFAAHELIEASESYGVSLGVLGEKAFNLNPSDQASIFHENGIVGSILRSLVGYSASPEWLRIIVYLGYWTIIGGYLYRTFRSSSTIKVQSLVKIPN